MTAMENFSLQKSLFLFFIVTTILLINYFTLKLFVVTVVYFNYVLSVCVSHKESIAAIPNLLIWVLMVHLLVFDDLLYLSISFLWVQPSVLLLENFPIWVDPFYFALQLTLLPINLLLNQFPKHFVAYDSICWIGSLCYVAWVNHDHIWVWVRIDDLLWVVLSLLLVLVHFFIRILNHLYDVLFNLVRLFLLIGRTCNFCATYDSCMIFL